jgi:hypothetical protein
MSEASSPVDLSILGNGQVISFFCQKPNVPGVRKEEKVCGVIPNKAFGH